MKENTVILSLQQYEEMKTELESLRRQVQEKTIVKYVPHPSWSLVPLVIVLIITFFLYTHGL